MAIPAYYSLIQRGSSGPDVALVQTWLNGVRDACTWHDPQKADGKFGLSTENAVKEFQLKNKMNVDGKVGANTWNVLYTQYTAKHGLHVPYPGIPLRRGSSGGTVRLVQQKLNSLGERLTADGRYGAATAAAVMSAKTSAAAMKAPRLGYAYLFFSSSPSSVWRTRLSSASPRGA